VGINLMSLIAQMVTFTLFVLFTMKFVWPPIIAAMQTRQNRISEGLAAADKAGRALDDAKAESEKLLVIARKQAQEVIGAANRQATLAIDGAKQAAQTEAERIKAQASNEVAAAVAQARETLRLEVGKLAVAGAQQILKREIDAKAHGDLLAGLAARI
jgi:F-type H+-transporting ATPase subunit b